MGDDKFFSEFINRLIQRGSNRSPSALCLVHGTDTFKLRQIVRDGKIEPSYCETLKQSLIFSFYGRPAYRSKTADKSLYQILNAPVYIILDKVAFEGATTAYPFDTGAYSKELYQSFIAPELHLQSFAFDPTMSAVSALVECYFETNNRYMLNRPLAVPDVENGAFEGQALSAILQRQRVDDALDDRASTIEIGLSKSVDINVESIRAVILPQDLADDSDLGLAIKSLGIEVRFYDFISGFSWNQYASQLLATVKQFYSSEGIL